MNPELVFFSVLFVIGEILIIKFKDDLLVKDGLSFAIANFLLLLFSGMFLVGFSESIFEFGLANTLIGIAVLIIFVCIKIIVYKLFIKSGD